MTAAATVAPSAASTPPATARFAGLEGLRTIGVIAVFATHTGFATGVTHGSFWTVRLLGHTYRPTLLLGHLEIGPAIFFMISAFLLYRPFAAAMYGDREMPSSREFLRRRAVRVFPGYWLAIAILFATNSIAARNTFHTFKIVTLTQIYTQRDFFANRTLVPTWTLATELAFYLFLIGYVAVMRRLGDLSPDRRLRLELGAVAVLCMGAFAWRFVVYHVHAMPEVAEFWLPGTIDVFALGIGLAAIDGYARAGHSIQRWNAFARRGDIWAVAAGGFYFAVPVLTNASAGIGVSHGWDAYLRNVFQMMCAFCLLVPVVFGDQMVGGYRKFVRLRPMAYVGVVSYGIYLWHDHWIVQAVHWSGGTEAFRGHFWLVGVSAFALSLIFGAASYHWIERPALDLDARLAARRKEDRVTKVSA